MSIPVAPSDFSSSSYPSLREKPAISKARLSRELGPIQMSLGVSNDIGESLQKQLNWLPVSWGNSTGGPLGEVLASTSISVAAGTNLSSLKAYESSPQLDSSPNGVLQKSTFVSLSNSSSGSSHIADNRSAPREC
ncbi:growth-regulating factor 1-like [Olea europaea var. sylvestris]|uniref:growth-regulating factor 1-like n=1 Tax=Olea europaea var. sylvestris TaxID=158386 RepID=UPI000C1D3732|nr:growth-regulating factor 1-like [Olea europaea var. sylvestris]